MIVLIDKETQIKVLLYGNPLKFACETLGVENMMKHKYSNVFTVSKEEVYEYTSIHGIPKVDLQASMHWWKAFIIMRKMANGLPFSEKEGLSMMKKTLMTRSSAKGTSLLHC